jgi:hypothetical protein
MLGEAPTDTPGRLDGDPDRDNARPMSRTGAGTDGILAELPPPDPEATHRAVTAVELRQRPPDNDRIERMGVC